MSTLKTIFLALATCILVLRCASDRHVAMSDEDQQLAIESMVAPTSPRFQ
jgi:hypothetical protein